MRFLWLNSLIWILLLNGCSKEVEEKCSFIPDKVQSVSVSFSSLEDSLPSIKTKLGLVNFLSNHPAERDLVFGREAYPNDSVFINTLFNRFSHPSFDTLLMETKKVFGDGSWLKQEFQNAFANVNYYYPTFRVPRVETIITGLETDLFVSDTLVVVGLDYFLGKHARYRPQMYEYMLRRYEKNFVVPSTILLMGIDARINLINPEDKTVLADMITYGKAYYFAKRMLPCVPDSVFIGYMAKEIAGAKANQDLIWKRLVEDEVFYNVSHQVKQKYIAERPKTLEVGEECPGRIGTWVGWQIVNEYMKHHPEVTLPELMQTSDAQKIFRESKYKPAKP